MLEKFKYVSCQTGELQTSLGGVIRSILINLFRYHFVDFNWRRFDDSIYR